MFGIFDFAMPATHSPQRYTTTVPQQALFLMNSPFVIEQARTIAKNSVSGASHFSPSSRVEAMFQLVCQRLPSSDELRLATSFIATAKTRTGASEQHTQVWQYGYGSYDAGHQRVVNFHPLPYWTGDAWQGGSDLPDPLLGRAMLTADGGHPGRDHQHSVIRRWIAPSGGEVTILGLLAAPPGFGTAAATGDGIEARIVSSRGGELGHWTVYLGFTDTRVNRLKVQAGETIDFVVDCRSDPHYDNFAWSPTIRMASGENDKNPLVREWNATSDFSGRQEPAPPALEGWEKLAQILLMSNEFVFLN